jgi:hypothetical protein
MNSKQEVRTKILRDLYKGTYEFKKGFQPRINLAKDKNGDLLADSHTISKLRKKCRLKYILFVTQKKSRADRRGSPMVVNLCPETCQLKRIS